MKIVGDRTPILGPAPAIAYYFQTRSTELA